MEASTAVATRAQRAPLTLETEGDRFDAVARMAQAWAKSTIIPAAYQGKPSNCLVAIEMSRRTGVPVLAVMQNLHVIQGKPSWSATFLIAAANACGRFSPLRYTFVGERGKESWGCYVSATDLQSGAELVGETITIGMAKEEGWSTKTGSKWKTMPGQMLRYRAATFWARVYAPELTVGFRTADEVEDITPMSNDRVRDLASALDDGDDESPATPEQVDQLKALREKARAAELLDAEQEQAITDALVEENGPAVRSMIQTLEAATA